MTQIPTRMKAFVLEKGEGKPGKVYHPAGVQEIDVPKLKAGEVLVKISAAAYNHRRATFVIPFQAYSVARDLFIRQGVPLSVT
jgi:hypothetical protein